MLNGDVLTDIDLTAQLRQHEQTGARARSALIAVEDPSAYGLVRRQRRSSVREFWRSRAPDEIDTNLINAGAYVLEREVLDAMAPAGTRISIERDVFPRLVGDGLYGYEASGLLDGHRHAPTAICRRPTTSSTARSSTDRRARSVAAAGRHGPRRRRDDRRPRSHAPARARRRLRRSSAGATVGGRTVLGAGVTLGAGRPRRSSVLLDGARVGAGTRIRRTRSLPRARDRRALPHRCTASVLGAGRPDRGRQHPDRRHRVSSPAWSCPTERSRFEPRPLRPAVPPTRSPPSTRHASSPTSSACPSTCATRCGACSRPTSSPQDSPGGLVVAGMGGSAIGGALARAALGDRASRPIAGRPRLRAAGLDDPRHDRAVLAATPATPRRRWPAFEAAGALGARRIVCTTGGPLAEQARAEGVPVIPLPGGFQPRAAVGYALVVALEVAALAGAGERLHTEIDVAAAHAERLVAQWGPDAPRGLAGQGAGPRRCTARSPRSPAPGLTAPSPTAGRPRSTRTPSCRRSRPSCPSSTTTRSSAGRAPPSSAASAPCSWTTRDLHPRVRQRIELTPGADRRPRRRPTYACESDRETRMERLDLAGPAGRPGVAVPGRPAGRRSRATIDMLDTLKARLAAD